jgi:hypothetical protein
LTNFIIKPAVPKKWLILVSGILWSATGILLIWISSQWFAGFEQWQKILALMAGLMLGLIITWFGFRKLARKNADRISAYPDKVCLFAFQRWQMYILIVVMMSMGIFMRSTALIPKYLLAPVYIGIGSALFWASFVYFKRIY